MGKYRIPSENSKYYLPKEDYLTAVHYALRYPILKGDYDDICLDTSRAIRYDLEKVQTSVSKDNEVERIAMKRVAIGHKIDNINAALNIAAEDKLKPFLKLGVCYGLTYNELKARGIPCGKDYYYEIRRRFLYELAMII